MDVEVTIGKRVNANAFKSTSQKEIQAYATFLQKTATQLYSNPENLNTIHHCPCCTSTETKPTALVFQAQYVQCQNCGHVFVFSQPKEGVLSSLFASSDEHSHMYSDAQTAEARIEQIAIPKLDWITHQYNRAYHKQPQSLLDVGAGGGHFVAAAQKQGIAASGIELSHSSRAFAKQIFQIDLIDSDFLATQWSIQPNLITLLGLLEYAQKPGLFIQKAHTLLSETNGMLIVEVPRWDSLTTALQRCDDAVISRHLDPTTHIHCFTDASIAHLLFVNGFRPYAAWYFGLDTYEFAIQQTHVSKENIDSIPNTAMIQQALDAAKCCDDLVIAALPM